MHLLNVYERKTHKYADGYDHHDEWEHMGTLKLTPRVQVREGNDYGDGGTYVQYARLPAGYDWRHIAQSVQDTMSGSNCTHEYDCCGCARRRVRTQLIRPRVLQIKTKVTYNY